MKICTIHQLFDEVAEKMWKKTLSSPKNEATVTLWARVGVEIKVTEEEYQHLLAGGEEGEILLKQIFEQNRWELSGETYFPTELGHHDKYDNPADNEICFQY